MTNTTLSTTQVHLLQALRDGTIVAGYKEPHQTQYFVRLDTAELVTRAAHGLITRQLAAVKAFAGVSGKIVHRLILTDAGKSYTAHREGN